MNYQQILLDIGLDKKEAEIYLALASLKQASAGDLGKKTGIPRTYTYKFLTSLSKKGLVRFQEQPRSIRKYEITDFHAPQRYLHEKQFFLHRTEQQLNSLEAYLETLSNPFLTAPRGEELKDEQGKREFWQLLHSTITREIWIINPPIWWGDQETSFEVKKWEQYRQKQHIWEKRFIANSSHQKFPFTEIKTIASFEIEKSSLFLVDHYQIQISHWTPFRALRIESQEITEVIKKVLGII